MPEKPDIFGVKEQQTLNFSRRFCYVFLTLFSFVFITHILNFSRHGYNRNGTAHHSVLDYPNEITSAEAIELSEFISALQEAWRNDLRIYYPFDKQLLNEKHFEKEINVQDPVKKQSVLKSIAEELGLSYSQQKTSLPPNTDIIAKKIRGGPPKKNIAIPNNIEYLSLQNNNNQCDDDQRPQFKTSKTFSFHPNELSKLSVHTDGLFHDSSTIRLHRAEVHTIVFNLTMYGESESVMSHVFLEESNEGSRKAIHIHNRQPSTLTSCLTYRIDILFPAKMKTFEEIKLKVNHAHSIQGDLRGILFRKFTVGLGRGAILLNHIKADHILLGNLNGMIRGSFSPIKTMGAATVKGSTLVRISSKSTSTKSTLVALYGPVHVVSTTPGEFIAHCWLCEPNVSTEADTLHFYASRRPEIKSGYYGNPHKSHVNLHSIQGESKLTYVQ